MNMNERVKRIVHLILVADCAILLVYASFTYFIPFLNSVIHPVRYIKTDDVSMNVSVLSMDHNEASISQLTLPRGTMVSLQEANDTTSKVEYNDTVFTIGNEHLASSLEECISSEYVYPRRMLNLFDEKDGKLTETVADKGDNWKSLL